MAIADWEVKPNGDIKLCPLAGYEVARPFGMMCAIRFDYFADEQQLLRGQLSHLPLGMTVAQARELAAMLQRAADKAEQPPTDGRTQ